MFSFGEIAKTTKLENVRNRQRAENVASIKNRRLAAQMTQRMGLEESKGTAKSRLSIPIANRLGTKRRGFARGGASTRGGGRGRAGGLVSRLQRGSTQTSGRSALTNRGRGLSRGGRMGRWGRVATRGRRGSQSTRGSLGGQTMRGGRLGQTSKGRGRPVNQRGNVGSRGGRGRGRGANQKPVSKEQLDTELDKYMSKTKSVLNSQLDEYMKGSDY